MDISKFPQRNSTRHSLRICRTKPKQTHHTTLPYILKFFSKTKTPQLNIFFVIILNKIQTKSSLHLPPRINTNIRTHIKQHAHYNHSFLFFGININHYIHLNLEIPHHINQHGRINTYRKRPKFFLFNIFFQICTFILNINSDQLFPFKPSISICLISISE